MTWNVYLHIVRGQEGWGDFKLKMGDLRTRRESQPLKQRRGGRSEAVKMKPEEEALNVLQLVVVRRELSSGSRK